MVFPHPEWWWRFEQKMRFPTGLFFSEDFLYTKPWDKSWPCCKQCWHLAVSLPASSMVNRSMASMSSKKVFMGGILTSSSRWEQAQRALRSSRPYGAPSSKCSLCLSQVNWNLKFLWKNLVSQIVVISNWVSSDINLIENYCFVRCYFKKLQPGCRTTLNYKWW